MLLTIHVLKRNGYWTALEGRHHHLDGRARENELIEEVLNVMISVAKEGMTMVVVTHEMGFATKAGTRLLFMDEGRIIEDGDPRKLIKSPESDRLKNFLRHVIEI